MIAFAQSPEAEAALLGSVMLDRTGEKYDRVVTLGITALSFTDSERRTLWKALGNLHKRGIAFDSTTVAGEFRDMQSRCGTTVGSFDEIIDDVVKPFTNEVGSSANAEHYAKLVREQERRRSLRQIARELDNASQSANGELYDEVESIGARLGEITLEAKRATSGAYEPYTLGSILRDEATWKPIERVQTGFAGFDHGLGGGLRVGSVHAFTGPTGNGKSQTVAQIAANAALAGTPVAFVSLELSRMDVAQLIVAAHSGVDRSKVADLTTCQSDDERAAIRQAIADVADWPLVIFDNDFWRGGLTRSGLAALVADGVKRFRWKIVVVDYCGLLEKEDGDGTDYAADVANSTALKRIAVENRVAMLAVVALRKSAAFKKTGNVNSEIALDDILGAGRFVYDCDTVFVITCEHPLQKMYDAAGGVVIRTLKSRFSNPGAMAELNWYPRCGRIIDVTPGVERSECDDTPY